MGTHVTDPPRRKTQVPVAALGFIMFTAGAALSACGTTKPAAEGTPPLAAAEPQAKQESSATEIAEGQRIFRFETFGDEQLWTDQLHLNEVVEKNVDPTTALKVGLKVDADALPAGILEKVDLKSPATTVALLKMNAVVGLQATVDPSNHITRLGVTCALCHSTVDNSLAPGIGRRLDGWPNLDLDVGKIVGLSQSAAIAPFVAEFAEWGPGKYDARHHAFDGRRLILLNTPSIPVVIPPAYGLRGVGFETYTGDGPISYWNAYVGITQMGGEGTFDDPRIPLTVRQRPDRVQRKLPALLAYQLSLPAPPPPAGSFDPAAAARGQQVFDDPALGEGRCARCHIPPTYTDVLSGPDATIPVLHDADEISADAEYASRSATGMYRTTPLRALWQHPPYFHDGRAADLFAVVAHYETTFGFTLTAQQKADLVAFLQSL